MWGDEWLLVKSMERTRFRSEGADKANFHDSFVDCSHKFLDDSGSSASHLNSMGLNNI